MRGLRWLNEPREANVAPGPSGCPESVEGVGVATIREEWLVEEGWWTGAPVRRHYFELVLETGDVVVVFRDLRSQGWFAQHA